jgi:hypothetical protein
MGAAIEIACFEETAPQEKIFRVHATRFRAIGASASIAIPDSRAVERV